MNNKINKIIILIMLFLIIFSCFRKDKKSNLQEIFKLKIGYETNSVGVYFEESVITNDTFKVFQTGGFYYISDQKNNKIMKITKSGAPILIIYNSHDNPQLKPTIQDQTSDDLTNDDDIAFIKIYKEFSIYSPGLITADIYKNIYVINNNPEYKKIREDDSVVESMVLKFDKNGKNLLKIGKEGINSNPFGNIINMICDNKNNLIIQEHIINGGYIIYKFNSNGELLSKTEINKDIIPLSEKEIDLIVDIIDVKLGFNEDEVYITCQYIRKITENFSIINYDVLYENLFKYSLKAKKITKLLIKSTPKYLDITKTKQNPSTSQLFGDKKRILLPMENLIGVDISGNIYYTLKQISLGELKKNNHVLNVYDSGGKLKESFIFKYPLNVDYCSDLFLSPSGKVYSYYIIEGDIQFVIIN